MTVQQSGSITPGHSAIWVTDNVIKDGGGLLASQRVLTSFIGANFNDTGDQALVLPPVITAFMLTGIIITNASISLTTAVGGFYPAASKGGTAIVAAGQVYSSLTTSAKLLSATLVSGVSTTRYSIANLALWEIIFSLTTPQGALATADIYALGIDLSV